MAPARLAGWRGRAHIGAVTVRSPCVNVCVLDRRTGWCEGCARTIDEIQRWPLAAEPERAAIAALLPARQAQLKAQKAWWRRW